MQIAEGKAKPYFGLVNREILILHSEICILHSFPIDPAAASQ